MPNILSDNTVIPSYLGTSRRGGNPGGSALLNDYVLRLGEVKKLIYPDDPLSYGKKTVEYEVEVQYREGNGIYTSALYRGVTVSTMFGGIADRFHATFRADTGNTEDDDTGNGSKVLVLCLAGDQQKAIILGGVEDPTDERKEEKDTKHNLYFEFNGVRFTIDKDGRPTLLFRGATKEDGELADGVDKNDGGATFTIDKDGTVRLFTTEPDDSGDIENSIVLDHLAGGIFVKSSGKHDFETEKKFDVKAKDGFQLNSSEGGVSIGVKKKVLIDSEGVEVGDATENWVLGKTWRQDLKSLHSSVKSALSDASQALSKASIQLKIAAGTNAIPYTGGSAAQSSFQQVSTALSDAGQGLSKAADAIGDYEGKADKHLSKVNFGD